MGCFIINLLEYPALLLLLGPFQLLILGLYMRVCMNKLTFKDLPSNMGMLYDIPAPQLKDDLYGEIKKIPVQQN